MENIKCIFCNSESNEILITENGYSGRKCPTCGLIYVSPRPGLNDIVNLYSHDNAHIPAINHITGSFKKTLYAKHNLKIIKKYNYNGKLLDIGAGAGFFLNEARKQGFKSYGIELNEMQANFINEKLNIPCEQSLLNDKTFNNEKFDIIYHSDVISHFYDPIAEFEKIRFKLNENGFVIFETGNLGDVKNKYLKYFTNFQFPDHLFFFNENNIKILLERTGFEMVKIYRYSILTELLINKVLLNFVDFRDPQKKLNNSIMPDINQLADDKKSSYKRLLKNSYSYFIYLIRYKLGLIMPKKGRPQTIIVIAKKK